MEPQGIYLGWVKYEIFEKIREENEKERKMWALINLILKSFGLIEKFRSNCVVGVVVLHSISNRDL